MVGLSVFKSLPYYFVWIDMMLAFFQDYDTLEARGIRMCRVAGFAPTISAPHFKGYNFTRPQPVVLTALSVFLFLSMDMVLV